MFNLRKPSANSFLSWWGPIRELFRRTISSTLVLGDKGSSDRDLLSALKQIETETHSTSEKPAKRSPTDAGRLKTILAEATFSKSPETPVSQHTFKERPSSSQATFSKESLTWETVPFLNIFNSETFRSLEEPKSSRKTPAAEVDRLRRIEALNDAQQSNIRDSETADSSFVRWKFPIDGDDFLVEEKDVPFADHVLLEYLLDDLPKSGPVRRFMEMVVVGLQKNPYLSVAKKREHVEWMKTYLISGSE